MPRRRRSGAGETGRPLVRRPREAPPLPRPAAVTVFADNCTDADAWATALMALGEQRGPALAAALDLKALFIVRDGEQLQEAVAPALQRSALWQGAD